MPFVTKGRGRRLQAIDHASVIHIFGYRGEIIKPVVQVVLPR